MAKGINKVFLLGRVGKIETFERQSNVIVKVSLATGEMVKNKSTGSWEERTEWHNVIFFGKLAEIAQKYIEKGAQIHIEGKIKTNKYTDESGVDKYSTQIIANDLQLLSSKKQDESAPREHRPAQQQSRPAQQQKAYEQDDSYFDDSIPF